MTIRIEFAGRIAMAAIIALTAALLWATAASAFDLMNPTSWPIIPVPEVATDPNAGTTVGILPVYLDTDSKDQIRNIIAPDINWNTTLGAGGNFRYLAYPSEDTNWYAVAGGSWKIARKVDLDYQGGRTHKNWWSYEGRLYFERDPTERFFGVGNDSSYGNQSNYTTQQLYAEGIVGLNFTDRLQLSVMERPRWIRIQKGAFNNLPDITKEFPRQKGLGGGSEILTQPMLQYDSRDSVDIPRSGGLYRVFYGIADRRFGSSVSYNRFGAEIRQYYSIGSRITLVGHLFTEYQPAGGEMPFWAMARLGGDDSELADQQPLRGYGTGRFVDNNLSVGNFEMRTRVYDANLFGTHGTLEVAPFAEAGRVARSMSYDPVAWSALHPVGGVGFRGIAEPFVVGYVDVGWGGEGAAVFSGINYPF